MFEVKVTVDLGEKTLALLTGGIAVTNTPKAEKPATVEAETRKEETGAPEPDPSEPEKRTRRTKDQIAAEKAARVDGWDDMDNDAKLEAIRAEVTKHTKKGKSADIKLLLSEFDAVRASDLAPEDYDAFYDAIIRYGKGDKKPA